MEKKWNRVYVDASFRNNKAGIGVVLKESKDKTLYTYNEEVKIPKKYVNDICFLELVALKIGLKVALELGCKKLKAKGDSNSVRRIITRRRPIPSKYIPLTNEIFSMISKLDRVEVANIPRKMNVEAHNLARKITAS